MPLGIFAGASRLGLVLVGLVGVACGAPGRDGRPSAPATSPAAVRCTSFGATRASSGTSRVTRRPAVALLVNVQVQASACIDEVAFSFRGGTPSWSVRYVRGPLVADPSGRPVSVAGTAHLVLRFRPAAGVDLSSSRPAPTYDGPARFRPAAPSGVAEVRRLGDVEATLTWAIGLNGRRRFRVVTRHRDQLVVRIAASVARAPRCAVPGTAVTAGYPPRWFTELSPRWACRFFGTGPFVVHPASDWTTWAVTVARATTSAATVLAEERASGLVTRSRATRVAGLAATVLDLTTSGRGLYPPGYRYRVYVVATSPRALLVSSTPGPPGARTDADRAGADRLAALLRRR